MADRILLETPFLRCIDRDGWFFAERPNAHGVVVIVAITGDDPPDGRLILVEQRRPPVQSVVIELPAGLAGDEPGIAGEDLEAAARRELREETGYEPGRLERLADCPSSPGLTNEMASFFLATKLTRVGTGGGTGTECIIVHEVPLSDLGLWLRARQAEGRLVGAKVFAGLYLAGVTNRIIGTER